MSSVASILEALPQLKYKDTGLFSFNYLESMARVSPEWQRIDSADVYRKLESLLELARGNQKFLREGVDEGELEDKFINRIIEDILGFHRRKKTITINNEQIIPDSLLFASSDVAARFNAANPNESLRTVQAILEAKAWGVDLDKKQGNKRSPSGQLIHYMTLTGIPYGILTDGKYWRLYTLDGVKKGNVYFQVNLSHLISVHDTDSSLFEFFFNIFSSSVIVPQSRAKKPRIELLLSNSKAYGRDLEKDLKQYMFTAVEWLMTGLSKQRDGKPNDESLSADYETAITLMYRLLFVLRAEDTNLLPIQESAEYRESISLRAISDEANSLFHSWARDELLEEKSGFDLFNRLRKLSKVVDAGDSGLGLPVGFNGGLFSEVLHPKIFSTPIANEYLAAALVHITRTWKDRTGDPARINYSTVDYDHIGSLYEGLLEFHAKLADREYFEVMQKDVIKLEKKRPKDDSEKKVVRHIAVGDVYLEPKREERRNTGSYYTPDWVVSYGLRLSGLDNTLSGITDVKDLLNVSVCDPAMGSGHFLNAAARRLLHRASAISETSEHELPDGFEKDLIRKCVYGVDLNRLATLLAKLSIWVITAKKNRKLIDLDSNLKFGNSLLDNPENKATKIPNRFNWRDEFPEVFKKGGFTFVIGNPPWGSDIAIEKTYLTQLFSGLSPQNLNAFDLFVRQSLRLVHSSGTVSFVLPRNISRSDAYKELRRDCVKSQAFYIADVGPAFEGVTQEAVIVGFQKSPGPTIASYPFAKLIAAPSAGEFTSGDVDFRADIVRERLQGPQYAINFFESEALGNVYSKVMEAGRPLKKFASQINRGIEMAANGDMGKCSDCAVYFTKPTKKKSSKKCPECKRTYNCEQLGSHLIISDLKTAKHTTPILTGRDIKKFYFERSKFLRLGMTGVNYKTKYFDGNPSIFVQKNAGRLDSFYDPSGESYSTQTALLIKPNDEKQGYWLTALLNSEVLRFIYEYTYVGGALLTTALTKELLGALPVAEIKGDLNLEKVKQLVVKLNKSKGADVKSLSELEEIITKAYGLKTGEIAKIRDFNERQDLLRSAFKKSKKEKESKDAERKPKTTKKRA